MIEPYKKYIFVILLFSCLFSLMFTACGEDEPENPSDSDANIEIADAVDLGLSVKWASHNVGANKPSDFGYYFAWGETKQKSDYTDANHEINNYFPNTNRGFYELGIIDSNFNLTPEYDAASVYWGESWRIPTDKEFTELIDKCQWEWTSMNGHKGYKITGPNNNSIFLPAAGDKYFGKNNDFNKRGFYRTSPSFGGWDGGSMFAVLDFSKNDYYLNYGLGSQGCPVRPVTDK